MDLIFGPMKSETIWVLAIGGIIIAWFAAYQYKDWTGEEAAKPDNPPRHYTTFIRFYFFGLVYVAVFLMAFLILIAMPAQIVEYLKGPLADKKELMNLLGAIIDPRFIFAVLFITTASTKIPVIVTWEKQLRETLHDWAKTPSKVREVIKDLSDDYQRKFTVTDNDIKMLFDSDQNLKECLYSHCFNAGKYIIDKKDDLLNRWIEISYLRWKMNTTQPRSREHVCRLACANQYDLFKKNYDELRSDVELCYLRKTTNLKSKEMLENLKKVSMPPDIEKKYLELYDLANTTYKKSEKLLHRIEREASHKAESLLEELLTAICCGIFATQRTKSDRARALRRFNLDSTYVGHDPVHWVPVVTGVFLVFITALISTSIYHNLFEDQAAAGAFNNVPVPLDYSMVLLWAVSATLLQGFAVVSAIYFSRQTSPGTKREGKKPPEDHALNKFKAAIWASLSTSILCLCILLTFAAHPEIQKLLTHGGAKYDLWMGIKTLWPWCLMPLVTAVFTVIHREDAIAKKIDAGFMPLAKRCALQAISTSAAAALASLVFLNVDVFTDKPKLAFFIFAASVALLIGGVLGWVIPKGYRDAINQKEQQKAAAGSRSAAPAMGT